MANSFGSKAALSVGDRRITIYRLDAIVQRFPQAAKLPFSLKILLENLLRTENGLSVRPEDIEALATWNPKAQPSKEIAFTPARVLMQDFTGVPAIVDLAAMRDAMVQLGGDPKKINPLLPAELVIDHSVQVDDFGNGLAFRNNAELEFARNRERYAFLRWGQKAFRNFKVVPPDTGIVHQVNLEYLARVVFTNDEGEAYPDTVVGTDSHTTMINGLGVLGWGVGGIEAEAAMLGQPVSMLIPEVVGFRLRGRLPEGSTATDLVLRVTELLRKKGVVGKFVEFFGEGLADLALADRATIANMAPEYGATCGIFPVDAETLRFLRFSGRPEALVQLVEAYCKEQGLFHTAGTPQASYSDTLELDLSSVQPALAGPSRPQDRVNLNEVKAGFQRDLKKWLNPEKPKPGFVPISENASATLTMDGTTTELKHGAVVIAAITSCTNTSNPSVMMAAGLVAKKAVEKGLTAKPWVKTSLAPGSKVVTDYLIDAGLMRYLEQLRFHLVGYGCTTCIAEGTPVLLANGTSRRIEQMPTAGGAVVIGPTADGRLATALQAELMLQGQRECVVLTLQDGRTLVCTPDHEIYCADGQWRRADQLELQGDRVVVGLEAPLDEPGADEAGYVLNAGEWTFSMDTPQNRLRTLAFARLLGHLLGGGSISAAGQVRVHVGQIFDTEAVLNDVEILTEKRPTPTLDEERGWTIALPARLTEAMLSLPGVVDRQRFDEVPTLPTFVLDGGCPVGVLREFLGGMFGAHGAAPNLNEAQHDEVTLTHPWYGKSTWTTACDQLTQVLDQVKELLGRCGVKTKGAEFGVSYLMGTDTQPSRSLRMLWLRDTLSFVEKVGFRYSAGKTMNASAAAVYWRTVEQCKREKRPLPSTVALLEQIGASDWFSSSVDDPRQETTLPTMTLQVVDRRAAGTRTVYDIAVPELHSFVAGTVAVHNCIGNSGPLPEPVSRASEQGSRVAAAVLSGNRNFEGRVHAEVRANYLASPPLVVAYALAGRVDIDMTTEPLGHDAQGKPVYLRDVWPSQEDVQETIRRSLRSEMFQKSYGEVFQGDSQWNTLAVPEGDLYGWDPNSTYVKQPPYFVGMKAQPTPITDITGARVLLLLGDSITTDHISPAGNIKEKAPAGQYLIGRGVKPFDFNSYGARRGHDEVMVRGTFANIRIKNLLVPGVEGSVTRHLPDGQQMTVFDASVKYAQENVPLIVIAGKEYGSGSSRDWAAKGPKLLGIRAAIAESYERIHRSNLVGMGIVPLQFQPGENATSLGLTGEEVFDFEGLAALIDSGFSGGRTLTVRARRADGSAQVFQATVRIDTPQEVLYYKHGGILPYVLRQLAAR